MNWPGQKIVHALFAARSIVASDEIEKYRGEAARAKIPAIR